MILPITRYGDPALRAQNMEIDKSYPNLQELIDNMFQTMYAAYGVGLAAPQIDQNIRLFIVDVSPMAEDEEYETIASELQHFKKVFINPKKIDEFGEEWKFNEGCLSIPDIRENVTRKSEITLSYYDENWKPHQETFSDIRARVIQHEYDHLEGILFTDYLSGLKKKLLKSKLEKISKGLTTPDYLMKSKA